MTRPLALVPVLALASCMVGSGDGTLAGRIFLPACGFPGGEVPATDGSPFNPGVDSFFGDAMGDRMVIRLQRGGSGISTSDGLIIDIPDRHALVEAIRRTGRMAVVAMVEELPALPPGSGVLVGRASLYLDRSCREVFVDFSGGTGTVTFESMYAREADGDWANIDAIKGSFSDLSFVDGRPEASVGGLPPWAVMSGAFDFAYTRGRPAQPFP